MLVGGPTQTRPMTTTTAAAALVAPFAVPPGWRVHRRGPALVATGPGPVPARLEWRCGSPPAYEAEVVEDEDSFDLAGREVGYRRVGHRAGGRELLSEEWTWSLGEERRVLTGTVAREAYLSVCDLFEDVAATVEPGTPSWSS